MICLASGAVAAIVACGDDGGAHKLPDAPLSDATPDTPDTPQPVRLTILQNGSGVEGVNVYFQNANSSLVAKVPTDANGVAEAVVDPNAFVTVVDPFGQPVPTGGPPPAQIRTVAGVQPGDQLRLVSNIGRQALTLINLSAPQDPNASQFDYRAWSTCLDTLYYESPGLSTGSGSTDRPAGGIDLRNCGATTDLLVESGNGSGASVGYIFKDNIAVANDANIDLQDAYVASGSNELNYSDIPSNVSSIYARNVIATSDGPLWIRDGYVGTGSGGPYPWSYTRPEPAGSTQIFDANMSVGLGSHHVVDWKPVADASTFSLATTLLREFMGNNTYDAATHTATWDEAATGVAPEFAIVEVLNYGTTVSVDWHLAGVPTAGALAFPVLPTEIAQYNIGVDDSPSITDLWTFKVPGGYNAARPFVMSDVDSLSFAAGASGRAVSQQFSDPRVRAKTAKTARPNAAPARTRAR